MHGFDASGFDIPSSMHGRQGTESSKEASGLALVPKNGAGTKPGERDPAGEYFNGMQFAIGVPGERQINLTLPGNISWDQPFQIKNTVVTPRKLNSTFFMEGPAIAFEDLAVLFENLQDELRGLRQLIPQEGSKQAEKREDDVESRPLVLEEKQEDVGEGSVQKNARRRRSTSNSTSTTTSLVNPSARPMALSPEAELQHDILLATALFGVSSIGFTGMALLYLYGVGTGLEYFLMTMAFNLSTALIIVSSIIPALNYYQHYHGSGGPFVYIAISILYDILMRMARMIRDSIRWKRGAAPEDEDRTLVQPMIE